MANCRCCGQCCAAFYVRLSHPQLLAQAQHDKALGLTMLESDAVFMVEHCKRLSPEEARLRSPNIINSPRWPHREYWTCEYLRGDGRCQLNVEGLPKPHLCTGYPWYGGKPQADKWLFPGCGYPEDLLSGLSSPGNRNEEGQSMAVKLNELAISMAEVVDYTRITGGFAEALQEVVRRKITVEAAKEKGLTISPEELQRAADVFRTVNNLKTADDTENWLKENGLSLEALEDHLETNLLIFKFKEALEKEADKEKYVASPSIQGSIRQMIYRDWLASLKE